MTHYRASYALYMLNEKLPTVLIGDNIQSDTDSSYLPYLVGECGYKSQLANMLPLSDITRWYLTSERYAPLPIVKKKRYGEKAASESENS